ncbi:MAG: phytanoyl-CoA dioxygenase family protein [Chitinophagales bacterium]|nr:phytanoyl-CoA dioxygenase family protein [Chitinophagales bacterium]MDW8273869.1 phytanoyl-CoA dioxygenase family protein [Chitinophagales bacterium]
MNNLILKKRDWNNQLIERGYTVGFSPVLAEICPKVLNFYHSNPFPGKGTFHTTHFATDKKYKSLVHYKLVEFFSILLDDTFFNYVPVFANFMVKEGGGKNEMPLHADWTYVNEDFYNSFAIWIPLSDTHYENGCIGVIPFSHRLSPNIRGPRIRQWNAPTDNILISQLGKLLPMKVGQFLIYNHKTLHFSPPNNSSAVRVAVNISVAPKSVSIIHYCRPEGENDVLKFLVEDDDFFLQYDNFQMPQRGRIIERISEEIPTIDNDAEQFVNRYKHNGWIKRLLRKLNNV